MRYSLILEDENGNRIDMTSTANKYTKIGEKSVILERGGVTENIINRLVSGSTWLTLREGENKFYLRASSGLQTLKVQLIHRNAYLGV